MVFESSTHPQDYNGKISNNHQKVVSLIVSEAYSRDVGRGIARIDPKVAKEYNIETGDALEISSEKSKSLVLNWMAHPEDYGKGLIRIDGYIRNKLGIGINDKVKVKRIDVSKAKHITVAPTEHLKIRGAERYILNLLQDQIVTKGDIIPIKTIGLTIHLKVISTNPPTGALLITNSTRILISKETVKPEAKEGFITVTYEDIGGLRKELIRVREMLDLPLRHPEIFKRLGIEAPKGILLHGPPGTGKTYLAKAIANETNANFYSLTGPEIMGKLYGESEERLRSIFYEADKNAPSIIFIDEIDSIAPKREEALIGEVERRVVSQLLSLMDGLSSRGKVVVIGATNRVNAIDPALRRPGRFDREIELGVPDRNGRLEILYIHARGMPLNEDVDIEKIADITHGFVGADLQALAKEAAIHALRRVLPDIDLDQDDIPQEILSKITITMQDFTEVLKEIEPSAMREVFVEIPHVGWQDVGGLETIKQKLIESIEWPIKYPELLKDAYVKPPKGIFLYGPPGTGKTLMAKAIANESEANFISIKGPELISKWVGESEKGVREVFRKARQAAPCIVFFDEIDSIAPVRGLVEEGNSHVTERVISQLLTELDGLEELRGVVVIAASNRPDIVDPALLRPGRFDRLLYIPPPDRDSRLQILRIHIKDMLLAEDVDILHLADITEGFTGADIASFTSEAAMSALREHVNKYSTMSEAKQNIQYLKVYTRHFEESIKNIHPLSPQELNWYKNVAERFGKPVFAKSSLLREGGIT